MKPPRPAWRRRGGEVGALPAAVADALDRFVADGHASAAAAVVVRCAAMAGGDGAAHAVYGHAVGTLGGVVGGAGSAGSAVGSAAVAAVDGPIDLDTPFDLASLTKPIATSSLLAGVVASGRAGLDEPVALAGMAAPLAAPPTLASLLGHASGWPAWRDFFAETASLAGDPQRRAQAIRRAVLATPFERAAGEVAVYSDLGFMTLGWWLEDREGAALDRLFDARLVVPGWLEGVHFRPLAGEAGAGLGADGAGALEAGGRRSGAVVATEIWPPRCADGAPLQGVVHDDNAAGLLGVAGHAGLFGSARGVAGFAADWLDAVGDGARRPAVDRWGGALPGALASAWVRTAAAPGTSWRLGWDTPSGAVSTAGTRASARAFGHLGFVGTSVWIDPARDAAVVLLTNRVRAGRAVIAPIRALRVAVHEGIWAWIDAGAEGAPRVAISSPRS